MSRIKNLVLMGVLLLLSLPIFAEDDFFSQHAEGWHWYETDTVTPVKKEPQTNSPIASSISPQDPLKTLEAIQHDLAEAKALAVLYPTPANVANYIRLQNAITANANQFGNTWQQVIWQNPGLNYSLSHPTSQIAKDAYLDKERETDMASLKNVSQHYGLFFFFASTCPYCHRFAPIIKDLQEKYNLSVIPISLDGKGLPEYPDFVTNKGQAEAFHVTSWPALFMVNPQKRQVIPITFGLIGEDEVIHRMVTLATKLGGISNRGGSDE